MTTHQRYKAPHAPKGTPQSRKTFRSVLARAVSRKLHPDLIASAKAGMLSKAAAFGFHPTRSV